MVQPCFSGSSRKFLFACPAPDLPILVTAASAEAPAPASACCSTFIVQNFNIREVQILHVIFIFKSFKHIKRLKTVEKKIC